MLLNRCPDHDSVELVYLGLSPELRGKRIGSALLQLGLSRLAGSPADHVACAVDLRNAPARRARATDPCELIFRNARARKRLRLAAPYARVLRKSPRTMCTENY